MRNSGILKFLLILSFAIQLYSCEAQSFEPFEEVFNRLVQGISFSPDGRTLYVTLPHRERMKALGKNHNESVPRLAIYTSRLKVDSTWSAPILIDFSGFSKDYEPTISPCGQYLLFNSNRGKESDTILDKNNIWIVAKEGVSWTKPRAVGGMYDESLEVSYPTMSIDSNLIYSSEILKDGYSEYHLFQTKFQGENTRRGERIYFANFDLQASDPVLTTDGRVLVFAGFEVGRWSESCDLYISFLESGRWSSPKPLISCNSPGPDFAPSISSDGRWLYYRKNYQFVKILLDELHG